MRINIRVIQATAEPSTTAAYIEGHRKVLEAYGVTKVTSANTDWKDDPSTFLIIAESEDTGRIHGGGRIQIKTRGIRMPLEDAIAILDTKIYQYTDDIGYNNVAEYCGLWNSKEIAGYGVGSIILVQIGVAVSALLGIEKLMALCSPATLANSQRVGFEIIREIGNNGTLYYPKEDLVATALAIHDLHGLPAAEALARKEILELRSNPMAEVEKTGPKGTMHLTYDLRVNELMTT
jgi:hypothetical protein